MADVRSAKIYQLGSDSDRRERRRHERHKTLIQSIWLPR
jgi:hypothetical protein